MSDDLVTLSAATRRYVVGSNTVNALENVNCSIKRQQHTAIMGASGSGKSTLLAMMAGLDQLDSGAVMWPSLESRTPLRPKYVSVSFQSPSLLPSLTVQQNIEVPLLVMDETEVEKKAMKALERLGLAHLRDRFPDELSGGQAQRVALSRAMATGPALLLADEPTGQLDQDTGQSMIATLIAWADETKSTLVVATHDPQVARKFNSRWRMGFGVLNSGDA